MKCNCDTEDGSWHTDEGFLSDKNTLPVTKLRFGDTKDGDSEGRYTLGPLECRGIGRDLKKTFIVWGINDLLSVLVNKPSFEHSDVQYVNMIILIAQRDISMYL